MAGMMLPHTHRFSYDGAVAMVAKTLWVLALGFALPLMGCEESDLGQACCLENDETCPTLVGQDDTPNNNTDSHVETQEIIAQDVAFRCRSLICVASEGIPDYCSEKCSSNATCPNGFECRVIQPTGEFGGEQFCTWKSCAKASDCGELNEEKLCCNTITDSDPQQEVKRCGICP